MLGHSKPVFPSQQSQSAAESYLPEATREFLISSFDKAWLRQSGLAKG
jgi:hypothetical protein